jgi:hypothetical protein
MFRRALSASLPAERSRETPETLQEKAVRASSKLALSLLGQRAGRSALPLRSIVRAMISARFGDMKLIGAHGEKEFRRAKDPEFRKVIATLSASAAEPGGPVFVEFCRAYRVDYPKLLREALKSLKEKS